MVKKPLKFAAIGECMIELAPDSGSILYSLHFAGDTFNTLVGLRRLIPAETIQTLYASSVGDDVYSDRMIAFMQAQGVDTSLIFRDKTRKTGLYLIDNDETGERSFTYYRQNSAASALLQGETGLHCLTGLMQADMIYFSGITLAIWRYDDSSWEKFESFLNEARAAGKTILFDSNHRPRLWQSPDQARACYQRFMRFCDVVLSTDTDEGMLYPMESDDETLKRIAKLGVSRVVLKRGEAGCIAFENAESHHIPCDTVENVVDTTGAGDAFNAGVIAGLIQGQTLAEACLLGHETAAKVIQHRGAILPA